MHPLYCIDRYRGCFYILKASKVIMSNRWNSGKYAIKYSCCGFYRDNGELVENSVIKKYLTTAADGKNYQTNHYNLQAIIAVGFKINNERAVQFRK